MVTADTGHCLVAVLVATVGRYPPLPPPAAPPDIIPWPPVTCWAGLRTDFFLLIFYFVFSQHQSFLDGVATQIHSLSPQSSLMSRIFQLLCIAVAQYVLVRTITQARHVWRPSPSWYKACIKHSQDTGPQLADTMRSYSTESGRGPRHLASIFQQISADCKVHRYLTLQYM